jgi:hypothetical protein
MAGLMSIPADVRESVVQSYYPHALSVADTARSRAQSGYGIASAIATGLVAAGALGKIGQQSLLVQILGLAAVVMWVVAALLFLWAVAAPVGLVTQAQPNVSAFVGAALQLARQERDEIDRRQRFARWASTLAAFLTVMTVTVALLLSGDRASPALSVSVSDIPSGIKVVAKVEFTELPHGAEAETLITGIMPKSNATVVYYRDRSSAGSAGKVSMSADLMLKERPERIQLAYTVNRNDRVLRRERIEIPL